jgi:hypothetical protein
MRVFAGITIVSGNITGLEDADAICQTEADNNGLIGTFKAWLSDATSSPSNRFSPGAGAYKLIDGTVVANSWADLTDGLIQNGITLTAGGETHESGTLFWTGTTAQGQSGVPVTDPPTDWCQNWTSGASTHSEWKGAYGATDSTWTQAIVETCQFPARLLCFEQAPTG